ncbi:MAG: hypothetical protein SVV80_10615 [Planctomycetota bacterium]|nr:hypothetical protein [Planctomycetota bacterium]
MGPINAPLENEQYKTALASVRRAKNCLWWLIVISIVIQMAAFVSVRFVGVLGDAPQQADKIPAGTDQATTAPSSSATTDDETDGSVFVWREMLGWILPATKFIAMVAGILLALTMLTAVQMSLVGRTGGAAGFTSGFFWSLLLLMFLIPWQQVVGSTFACGVLYNLSDLTDWTARVTWGAKNVSIAKQIFYYDRFLGYPVFVILLCLVVQAKFARGWRRADLGAMQADLNKPVDPNDKL